MSWLQCILYGFIMGFSEFIPVSSSAQSQILHQLFGTDLNDPLRNLTVHICSLAAFLIVLRKPLETLLSSTNLYRSNLRGNRRSPGNAESRFMRAAMIPMVFAMLLFFYFSKKISTIPLAVLLLVNGVILYLPDRMLQGNKSARGMSTIDAWLIGAAGALSVIPGFSRMGLTVSVAQMCGADRKHALNWAYTLSVPALILLIGADLAGVMFGGHAMILSTGFLGYLLLGVFSFAGSYLSVYFVRNAIVHHGLCAYAYYCWGSALFVFILYLL